MIKITRYTKLDHKTSERLKRIIEDEFGKVSIVRETEWATPDWAVIYYIGKEIASFYQIVERNISLDGHVVKIAGINNVITPREHRSRGYSSKLLKETEHLLFENSESKYAVLLCADDLLSFYTKLGWYKVDCPVNYRQATGEKVWNANTMLLGKGVKIFPKRINLRGLPW